MSSFFERAGTRHVLKVTMRTRTGVRIGRGRDHAELSTDLPLLRSGDTPFVPGSSWKGIIRTSAEALLRGLAPEDEMMRWACDPIAKGCLDGGGSAETESVAARRERIRSRVCKACATFGGMGLASHVRFADSPFESAEPMVRDGVGMDRDLARAADGLKYDYEVVSSGARLVLTVHMEAVSDWQVGLVLAALDDLDTGHLRVGGFGTRGLGWVECTELELTEQTLAQRLKRAPGVAVSRQRFDGALAQLAVA